MTLTREDRERFQRFLEDEVVNTIRKMNLDPMRFMVFTSSKLPRYKRIIKLYCEAYGCHEQYDAWVEVIGAPYRERARKAAETRRTKRNQITRGNMTIKIVRR